MNKFVSFPSSHYICLYLNYLHSDLGKLECKKFSPINSNMSDHLDEIDAFINRFSSIDLSSRNSLLETLVSLFKEVSEKYYERYVKENGVAPGNYQTYETTIYYYYYARE